MAALDNVDVRDCSLSVEDLANAEPVHLTLDQINLTATNLSNLPGTNLSGVFEKEY